MRPAFSILIVDHDTLITTIIILINIINIIILITREKDDVLEVESEGRDADDELAARLEAGEVVSLGGKVIVTMIIIIIIIIITGPKAKQGLAGGSLRASSAQSGSGK